MPRTMKKRKNRRDSATKRNVGGSSDNLTAIIFFIRNIAVQIINSIEESPHTHRSKSNKFYRMGVDKLELYKSMITDMRINFKNFRQSAGDMINKRNQTTHPIDLIETATIGHNLCVSHTLQDALSFEYKILSFFLFPKRVTRSMTAENPLDTVINDGNRYQNRRISKTSLEK